MFRSRLQTGDQAVIVEKGKTGALYHDFPVGTVVRIGKRKPYAKTQFKLFYCTAEGGDLDGLTQLVLAPSLKKIEK